MLRMPLPRFPTSSTAVHLLSQLGGFECRASFCEYAIRHPSTVPLRISDTSDYLLYFNIRNCSRIRAVVIGRVFYLRQIHQLPSPTNFERHYHTNYKSPLTLNSFRTHPIHHVNSHLSATYAILKGLLSMLSEPFLISLSCQREAEMASSKPFTFDWSDIPIVGDHDSYSSPPGSPTSVQHVNTYPTLAYEPSHFQTEPTKLASHTSYQTRRKNKQFTSSSTESSATQIPRSTKSNEKRVSFSSILEIRTLSLVLGDHPSCLGGMALECGGIDAKTRNCRLEPLKCFFQTRGSAFV
jgi:hypothetical protein